MNQEDIIRSNRGKVLRQTRRDMGLTMADVADKLGISVAQVSDVERGFQTRNTDKHRARMEELYQSGDGNQQITPERRPCIVCGVPLSEKTPGAQKWNFRSPDDKQYKSGLAHENCVEVMIQILERGSLVTGKVS